MPQEACYDLTAAAWLDADSDGQPDILLANGFHGLRLYKNKLTQDAAAKMAPPKLGPWSYIGPFDNVGQKGFAAAYPPEKDVDLKKQHPGRGGNVAWKQGNFPDGNVNSLLLFAPQFNSNSVVYLQREIEVGGPMELPISLGSDDTLTVWLNGEKLLAANEYRGCVPDQNKLTLKFSKPGKNTLLMKICQGDGDWAFYFAAGAATFSVGGFFEDVSSRLGPGPQRHGRLHQGRFSRGRRRQRRRQARLSLWRRYADAVRQHRHEIRAAREQRHQLPGRRTGAYFADFDGDGHLDLFVPQQGVCKLFRNDGKGKFTDVTDKCGDLAKPIPGATSAAWGDFNNDGHPDLFIGCLRGANRYFENQGDGPLRR